MNKSQDVAGRSRPASAHVYLAPPSGFHLTGLTCPRDLLRLLRLVETPGWRVRPRARGTSGSCSRTRRTGRWPGRSRDGGASGTPGTSRSAHPPSCRMRRGPGGRSPPRASWWSAPRRIW